MSARGRATRTPPLKAVENEVDQARSERERERERERDSVCGGRSTSAVKRRGGARQGNNDNDNGCWVQAVGERRERQDCGVCGVQKEEGMTQTTRNPFPIKLFFLVVKLYELMV
jgi:hypothetical protein